jgi:diketogulonate reductase-like aldo/keto reductase
VEPVRLEFGDARLLPDESRRAPGLLPLPNANRREHLAENLDVFEFELADEHLTELGALNEHWSALGGTLQYV